MRKYRILSDKAILNTDSEILARNFFMHYPSSVVLVYNEKRKLYQQIKEFSND